VNCIKGQAREITRPVPGTGSTNADALEGLVNGVLGEDSCGRGQCLVVGRAGKGQAPEFVVVGRAGKGQAPEFARRKSFK
jgi:hypothetical protein